jgi:serine phosphatase RsbU (regulator of sigma subunit)/DNA-binding GntR family transcriptional regulator
MDLATYDRKEVNPAVFSKGPGHALARTRLIRELFNGRYRPGQSVQLSELETNYKLDRDSVLNVLADFETLGLVTMAGRFRAVFHSPKPKEMLEAYEIRAALEEVGGRAAAQALKGNTKELQRHLDAMRVAFRRRDLDSLVEHDVAFHRTILLASGNEVLLRVWRSLAVDLRIRGAIEKVSKELPEVVESHQPIIDALHRGQGREAGLLLRNHVETLLEFIRKSDSDSTGIRSAMRRDLQDAKDVQEAFFPPTLSIPGLYCKTYYKPAQSIGGDYYDFLQLWGDRWGLAIGDVSGKGIGAALLMASLQASLRSQALHAHSDLAGLISDVDRLVYAASPDHLYASLFYAEYDTTTRLLRYVNAGHNSPIVVRWRDGQCKLFRLKPGGNPIGMLKGSKFVADEIQLEVGDALVAYTDGITEAENVQGELWGYRRLENLLRTCRDRKPEKIIRCILDEVATFTGGGSQRDDITLMVVGVKGEFV